MKQNPITYLPAQILFPFQCCMEMAFKRSVFDLIGKLGFSLIGMNEGSIGILL
jgi:hypothetical protein